MYLSIGKEVVKSNSSVREQNFSLEINDVLAMIKKNKATFNTELFANYKILLST